MSRYFTFADYRRFGLRHGFDYRADPRDLRDDQWVGRGELHEQTLRGGLSLVATDVHNRIGYTATAEERPGLSIRMMLDGQVDVHAPRRNHFTLRAGTAMTSHHREPVAMRGVHPGSTRLRGVSLMVPADLDPALYAQPELQRVLQDEKACCRHWAIPHNLLPSLSQLFDSPWQGNLDALWREGLALQILSVGLQADDLDSSVRSLRAGQQARLDRVRDYLHQAPGHDHSLAELAAIACMSASALRRLFVQQYGCSVFDYLHEQRMHHAERGLREEGWTVEQAASACGYRHPSNFAAAFRRRFGLVPSRWRTGPSKVG